MSGLPPNMKEKVDISVVIPCYNTTSSLEVIAQEFREVFSQLEMSYELILVNDGSPNPLTWSAIREVANKPENQTVGINLFQSVGQQSATVCGFSHARGDLEIDKFIEDMNLPEKDRNNIFCHSSLGWLGLKTSFNC
jgi:glycosyltransferase involved in cell wall biosynthesis